MVEFCDHNRERNNLRGGIKNGDIIQRICFKKGRCLIFFRCGCYPAVGLVKSMCVDDGSLKEKVIIPFLLVSAKSP